MQITLESVKKFIYDTSEYSLTLLAAVLSYFIIKKLLVSVINRFASRTKNHLDNILADSKVFNQLALIAPALVLIYSKEILKLPEEVLQIISAFITANMTIFFIRLFRAADHIYNTFEISVKRPIKGYIQLLQILAGLMGAVSTVYIALGKSPLGFISGLGAMTAVLLFIFKDTILSFIAGMQIMFNDLIHKGDWIEVPRFGADGDVLDIALYTVTVQNFDKTIVTIPTSKLLEGSFKNWRGVKEAGGRRIKRSINIDSTTVEFLNREQIEKFRQFDCLKEYLDEKLSGDIDPDGKDMNRRKLTNLGTFRAYTKEYLKNHPKLRDDMIILVRQLQPTPEGIPIEVYVFTNDTEWIAYEDIQSDIFDHLIAAVNEFDLKVFQHPTGNDLNKLVSSSK